MIPKRLIQLLSLDDKDDVTKLWKLTVTMTGLQSWAECFVAVLAGRRRLWRQGYRQQWQLQINNSVSVSVSFRSFYQSEYSTEERKKRECDRIGWFFTPFLFERRSLFLAYCVHSAERCWNFFWFLKNLFLLIVKCCFFPVAIALCAIYWQYCWITASAAGAVCGCWN